MRGLTLEEYRLLADTAAPGPPTHVPTGGREHQLLDILVEQGRLTATLDEDCLCGKHFRYAINAAGHEALKLWPVMVALECR